MKTVTFDREDLTIELVADGALYEVDLERCNNSAELLDWILQLAGKGIYADMIPEFLLRLEEACQEVFRDNAQGVYCPHGVDRQVDWRAGTSTPKKKAA